MKNLIEYYKTKATENERFLMLYVPIIFLVLMCLVLFLNFIWVNTPPYTPFFSNSLQPSPLRHEPGPSPFLHTSEPEVETPEPPVVEFNDVESQSNPNQSINITGTNTTIYINGKKIQ